MANFAKFLLVLFFLNSNFLYPESTSKKVENTPQKVETTTEEKETDNSPQINNEEEEAKKKEQEEIKKKEKELREMKVKVFWHGSAFLVISIASLLVIVNIFPKSEAYKKQQQRLDMAMKLQESGGLAGKISSPKVQVDFSPNATEIEKAPTLLKTEVTKVTEEIIKPTHTEVQVPVTKPSIPAVQANTNEIKFSNYSKVFETKSLIIENTCKELLNKLSSMVKTKSISIYFLHSDKFHAYMEKSLEIFTKYEAFRKNDLNDEVIKFLKNKMGAFSSNHSDAVLPLINKQELFGGVKIIFNEANPNLDITPIWAEIKNFAKNFEQVTNYNLSLQDTESSLFTLEHFQNIINYRITLDIPQNLTVVKIFQVLDRNKAMKEIVSAIKDVISKNPEAYKISEDSFALFLSHDERLKVSNSVGAILLKSKKTFSNLEFSVGSADFNSSYKLSNNWLERATLALNQAGKNQFKLYTDTVKS